MKKLIPALSIFALLAAANANAQAESIEAATPPAAEAPAEASKPEPELTPQAAPEAAEPTAPKAAEKPSEADDEINDYDMDTPQSLDGKLSLQLGFGVGAGNKEVSADLMSFHFEADYHVAPLAFAGVRYTSITGVKQNEDNGYVLQSYLVGAGYKQKLMPKWELRAAGYAGLTRTSSWDMVFFDSGKTTYSFTPAATVMANYEVMEKVFVTSGVGAQFGKAAWYDVQVGVGAFF
jgi:hypothetical protein